MIDFIRIHDKHAVWHNLTVESFIAQNLTTLTVIPSMKNSIDFCHTLNLDGYPGLRTISFLARTEIQYCLHAQDEILDVNMKTCVSNVNGITSQQKNNQPFLVFGSVIQLSFDLTRIFGIDATNMTYDECVYGKIIETEPNKILKNLLTPPPGYQFESVSNVSDLLNSVQRKLWDPQIHLDCDVVKKYHVDVRYLLSRDRKKHIMKRKKPAPLDIDNDISFPKYITMIQVKFLT